MATERKDARGRKIARQLDGLVDEKQSLLIRCEEGVVMVFDVEGEDDDELTRVSPLRDAHPELYGRMLALDAAVGKAGGSLKLTVWLVVIAAGILAATGVADRFLGIGLAHLMGFWAAFWMVGLTLVLNSRIGAVFQKIRYAGIRASLHAAIDESGLTVPAVVSMIEGGGAVSRLAKHLKIDIERGQARDSW